MIEKLKKLDWLHIIRITTTLYILVFCITFFSLIINLYHKQIDIIRFNNECKSKEYYNLVISIIVHNKKSIVGIIYKTPKTVYIKTYQDPYSKQGEENYILEIKPKGLKQ